MKIVRDINNASDIRKLTDLEAEKLVKRGRFKYVPRKVWKTKIRDINKNITSNI